MIYSHSKDGAFTAVKRDGTFYTRKVKGVPFVNRRYTRGVTFLSKIKGKELNFRAEPPRLKLC